MKITIISANPIKTQFNNVVCDKPILNDNSDVVIVNSDDYFDDKLFDQLLRLKKKYLAVFVVGFNDPELMLYNKQYVEFCFDNNINFLDFDQDKEDLETYLEQNLFFEEDYTRFAKFYLELQPEIDYTKWFKTETFAGNRVVDLGCGVPHYLKGLTPETYLGIDLSKVMVERANEQFPDYQFKVGDITNQEYEADVVISVLDVMNYLPDFDTVKAVLQNAYNNLSNGGEIIFDIHHKSVLRAFKDYFDFEDEGEEQFIWESNVDGHKLTHYFQIIDKDYKVFVEKHYQTYYDIDLILKYLQAIGFTNVTADVEYNHHIIRAKKETNE